MYIIVSFSFLSLAYAFHVKVTYNPRTLIKIQAHKKISGSFFNPIPPNRDEEEDNNVKSKAESSQNLREDATHESLPPAMDPFDQSLAELLKKNKKKQNTQNSSTTISPPSVDQIRTSAKALGFGKAKSSPETNIINTVSKKSFVGIGKPLNDITKPEFDEQGYTLYADEETGERKRVFEALVQYPCEFTMKIIGDPDGDKFSTEIVKVVAQTCDVSFEAVPYSERKYGKWVSITVKAPVTNAEMLYRIYENIDKDPRVKFKF